MSSANPSPHTLFTRTFLIGALLVIFTLAWSEPLWLTQGKTGRHDWGISLNVWEVRWKSVRDYGQWPAFNPWQGGGLPVNPALGYFSVQAVATFLLGPKAGLSVFIVFYLMLGLWGYWRLARELSPDPLVAAFLAAIGTASPGLAIHLTAGHLIFANLLVWPAIIYFLLRAEEDRWAGLKAGLLFALGFNEFAYYLMQYGGCAAAGLWVWRFLAVRPPERSMLIRFAFLGVIAALPFMLPSLIGIIEVARDYSRVANTPATFTPGEIGRAYLVPGTELRPAVFVPSMKSWMGSWEVNCYLGWGALLFFFFGCLRTLRWFHVALGLCLWFTLGNLHWWQPMRWLMDIPLFASLQSFNRLRLFTHLFFAIGAAWGLSVALASTASQPLIRRWLAVLAGLTVAEILLVSHAIARQSHVNMVIPAIGNEQRGNFYQRAERRGLPAVFDGWPADLMEYTRANIGIARESAATDSAFRDRTRVRTVNDADYAGEFVQNGHRVAPAYWSPNRLIFERLEANIPLTINLNRGSPWHNFNKPLFPRDRIVEFDEPFQVQPDAQGRIELSYVLPAQRISWWGALAGVVLAAIFCLALHHYETKRAP